MTTAFAGAVLDADGRPFDRIRLTGLSATGYHGVLDHEKAQGQIFRADVVLHLDTRAAASGDDLDRTVSYAGVAEDVVAVLAGSPADLVETVAERIAATILTHDEVVAVDVAVHKPQAPITVPFEDVEVVIRRDRVVVPVVAPLTRRGEQRDGQQPVAPIPVGSVAPALIHGVGDVPLPEDRAELAPAPDVMPPSIPPAASAASEAPVGDASRADAESSWADAGEPAPDDALDATREAPAVADVTGATAHGAGPSAEPVDAGPGHGEPGLGEPGHPEEAGRAEPAYPEPAYPEPAYAEQAHPETAASAHAAPAPGEGPPDAASYDALVAETGGPVEPGGPAAPVPAPPLAPAGHGAVAPEAPAGAPAEQVSESRSEQAPPPAPAPEAPAGPEPTPAEPAGRDAVPDEVAVAPVEHDRMDDVPAGFVDVVLALGANLGDAQQTLRDAITDLDRISGLEITEVSPLARTAAVGGPEQPDFLNTVLLARTRLSARALLHACQAVEQAHGRVRDERWGPRTLDVDLVVYGTLTAVADDLELPHPRAHERAFVLEPWSQIDPDAVLPGLGGGPVAALAATAPDRGGIRWLALDWLTDPAPEPTGGAPVATGSTDAAPPAPVPAAPAPAGGEPYGTPPGGPAPEAAPGGPAPGAPAPQAPVPPQVPHQALPQQVFPHAPTPEQPPVPQQPAVPQQPGMPQQPGAALPVAPPQADLPREQGPGRAAAAPDAPPTRPVFAPVSEGVAPPAEPTPPATPAGAPDDAVPPFPGPSARPSEHPAPDPAPRDAAASSEQGAPALPVFAPVHPVEAPPAAPEQGPAGPVAADDGIIRSVPFAPVTAPPAPAHGPTSTPTQASAPGPLADEALHPVTDPWPPFGPVSGSGHDAQR
ncbi:2-amino-4-hydroxy-6-hydroxymethyldihydropteridine diphosphokinase [Cellulosimicrobium composti]|uniref:2-amino-4-hydroxy-6- hydroxymethyldihydropteridine diphosphokinase n=1 Tax=Cellulosimicrobium composti TaxID=2672572 RepID=UPI0028A0F144|nr:2-amino-4-hydroxy-6-hydroxymethyldihydropteridine diphosphokinase [Cellulosimicrobium composti]